MEPYFRIPQWKRDDQAKLDAVWRTMTYEERREFLAYVHHLRATLRDLITPDALMTPPDDPETRGRA